MPDYALRAVCLVCKTEDAARVMVPLDAAPSRYRCADTEACAARFLAGCAEREASHE